MKSRNFRITVSLLGSGWAAVLLADYEDMGWCTDVEDTGIGRYATRAEALREAKDWSQSDGIPLEEGLK